jgi:cyclophilin family peptidyl-prolyl cis-trans isomerase
MKAAMINRRFFLLPLAAMLAVAAAPAPVVMNIAPPPEVAANPANRWTLQLSSGGAVTVLLRPDLAPQHVARIQALTRQGFYDGLAFHRVVPGFMAQGGDPTGSGEGGSKLPDLKAEFTTTPFLRGTVGAARTQNPDSANSQFFIMFAPDPSLDNDYTVVGRVISGMDAVDKIAPGEPPPEPTKIVKATIGG